MPKPTLEDGFRRPQHSLPFMVELPTNAYATPNSPKCKDAYSHLWNTLTSDAAFLLSRFIPVNNNVCSNPGNAGDWGLAINSLE
ncbi:hypothetical protein V6N13_030128 [Hibiscus sabdariffa]